MVPRTGTFRRSSSTQGNEFLDGKGEKTSVLGKGAGEGTERVAPKQVDESEDFNEEADYGPLDEDKDNATEKACAALQPGRCKEK